MSDDLRHGATALRLSKQFLPQRLAGEPSVLCDPFVLRRGAEQEAPACKALLHTLYATEVRLVAARASSTQQRLLALAAVESAMDLHKEADKIVDAEDAMALCHVREHLFTGCLRYSDPLLLPLLPWSAKRPPWAELAYLPEDQRGKLRELGPKCIANVARHLRTHGNEHEQGQDDADETMNALSMRAMLHRLEEICEFACVVGNPPPPLTTKCLVCRSYRFSPEETEALVVVIAQAAERIPSVGVAAHLAVLSPCAEFFAGDLLRGEVDDAQLLQSMARLGAELAAPLNARMWRAFAACVASSLAESIGEEDPFLGDKMRNIAESCGTFVLAPWRDARQRALVRNGEKKSSLLFKTVQDYEDESIARLKAYVSALPATTEVALTQDRVDMAALAAALDVAQQARGVSEAVDAAADYTYARAPTRSH